jgi:phospholipid transport system substrate-binding protein
VIVRSEVRGKGEPIQLDYRVGKVQDGANSVWKIYDINILSVWLVETYRGQFSQEINANGVDGLIKLLSERNKGGKK